MTHARAYVHGYSDGEQTRLVAQATTLTELLHADTLYGPGSLVLEAGCGIGAQTVTLATRSPGATLVSIDVSSESLAIARQRTRSAGVENVRFQRVDLYALPFRSEAFDHVFVCFVLEHLSRVAEALQGLKRVLKRGGTLTVIEGDHGSTYFHPESAAARAAIQCQVDLQRAAGGNALIGREVYPMLVAAGFECARVSPRMVYVDASRPHLVEGFTKRTFTAMVEGVGDQAIASGLIDDVTWKRGIRDLYRTAERDGTFSYTFFKGVGRKPTRG